MATLLFRGSYGLPITSAKLNCAYCWADGEFALDYVFKKYIQGPGKDGQKRTRFYSYGVSLGAQILGLYLGKKPEKAAQVLDGAALYATPWSTTTRKGGPDFFYKE